MGACAGSGGCRRRLLAEPLNVNLGLTWLRLWPRLPQSYIGSFRPQCAHPKTFKNIFLGMGCHMAYTHTDEITRHLGHFSE